MYVAKIPRPAMSIMPGTRPIAASTGGKERIPRDIVSAIMTII